MTVTNSCCCFGLRTGAMIIGWWGVIGGVFSTISYIQGLTAIPQILEMLNATMKDNDTEQFPQITEDYLEGAFYSMIAKDVVEILICALLLWGVHKNNRMIMLPWLITQMFYLVMGVLGIFIITIALFVGVSAVSGFVMLIVGFLVLILPIYFWLCVFSLYQRFKLEENRSGGCNSEMGFTPMLDKPPPYNPQKM